MASSFEFEARRDTPLSVDFDFKYQNLPLQENKASITRKIVSGRLDAMLCHNGISTKKYNDTNDCVRAKFIELFSKSHNLYLLIVGVIQLIKGILNSDEAPEILITILLIFFISIINGLHEDMLRNRADKKENLKMCTVLDTKTGKLVQRQWDSIMVGEIVRVAGDEYVPADMVLLMSSNSKGETYVQTKDLDGETNLKGKKTPDLVMKVFSGKDERMEFDYTQKIICDFEGPNFYIYKFNGRKHSNMWLNKQLGIVTTAQGEKVSLDDSNFILRGSSLKNTNYIYGLVCYTGQETKIRLNEVKIPPKTSKIMKTINDQISILLKVQAVLCFCCCLCNAIWSILFANDFKINEFVGAVVNWVITFSNLIPVSLPITLTIAQFLQGILICEDSEMVHKASKTHAMVHSSHLNEELGQIGYIFADKTGTLTQNEMEFKRLIVKGETYGLDLSIKDTNKFPEVTNVNFLDQSFFDALESGDKAIEDLLMCLAVCHTAIAESMDGKIVYNTSSVDELALINFAKFSSCEYIGTKYDNSLQVQFKKKLYNFRLLHVFEFTPSRKRMSVVVEDEEGQIILFCKGVDSIICELLKREESPDLEATMNQLSDFSNEGLRNLLFGKKVIPKDEYTSWITSYYNALTETNNREQKMEELQGRMERELTLLGATSIQEKLQDDVGETIGFLKEARIQIWLLAGDRKESAINFSYSCNLIDKDAKIFVVDGENPEEIKDSLKKAIDMKGNDRGDIKPAVIVSGQALSQVMREPLSSLMMNLTSNCGAVVCCRVTPRQKAEVVNFVRKHNPNVSTLAIGDGANDVNMITSAHVGVGIKGSEGLRAAMASDYAIGEFKLLKRLLVYHGRECYRKNSNLVLYSFFKNILLVFPIVWNGFSTGFSGQKVYGNWFFFLFNVVYTSVPIVIYALYDRELNDDSLLKDPSLYQLSLKEGCLEKHKFLLWLCDGVWQSLLVSIPIYFWSKGGSAVDILNLRSIISGLIVIVANFKVIAFSHSSPDITLISTFASIGAHIVFSFITNRIDAFSVASLCFTSFVAVMATSIWSLGQEKYKTLMTTRKVFKNMFVTIGAYFLLLFINQGEACSMDSFCLTSFVVFLATCIWNIGVERYSQRNQI